MDDSNLYSKKYWIERCLAAEKYIDESPCDPDIYPKQLEAYNIWIKIREIEPPKKNLENY